MMAACSRLKTTQAESAVRVLWTTPWTVVIDVITPLFKDGSYNARAFTACFADDGPPVQGNPEIVECFVAEQQLWHLFLMLFA